MPGSTIAVFGRRSSPDSPRGFTQDVTVWTAAHEAAPSKGTRLSTNPRFVCGGSVPDGSWPMSPAMRWQSMLRCTVLTLAFSNGRSGASETMAR